MCSSAVQVQRLTTSTTTSLVLPRDANPPAILHTSRVHSARRAGATARPGARVWGLGEIMRVRAAARLRVRTSRQLGTRLPSVEKPEARGAGEGELIGFAFFHVKRTEAAAMWRRGRAVRGVGIWHVVAGRRARPGRREKG